MKFLNLFLQWNVVGKIATEAFPIDTEEIDADYMNSRFEKYNFLRALTCSKTKGENCPGLLLATINTFIMFF